MPASRFDTEIQSGKLEKLPWQRHREVKHQERPILENSTACTMSNAKNLVR